MVAGELQGNSSNDFASAGSSTLSSSLMVEESAVEETGSPHSGQNQTAKGSTASDSYQKSRLAVQFARFTTNVGAPPFTFLLASVFLALQDSPQAPPLETAWQVGVVGGLAPLFILLILRLTNRIQTLDLSTFRERVIGFGLAIAFGLALIPFVRIPSVSEQSVAAVSSSLYLESFLIAHIAATALFFLSTLYTMRHGWKISVHSGGAASLFFIALFSFGKGALLWGSLFVLVIGWSRVFLKRHSIEEVVAGLVLGFSTYALVFSSLIG